MSDQVSNGPGARGRRPRFRPAPEALEGRALAAVRIFESEGILTILGDNRANNVQVFDLETSSAFDGPAYVRVVADGRTFEPANPVRDIDIDLRGGNDALAYTLGDSRLEADLVNGPVRTLRAFLGGGNDRVRLDVAGFTLDPSLESQGLGPGQWDLRFDLGDGNDRFDMNLAADLLGTADGEEFLACDLYVAAFGGRGNDQMTATATRPVFISQAFFDIVMRGGAGNDTLTMQTNGLITASDATIVFERYGDAGNDRILGTFQYETVGNVILDQVIDGGPGNDSIRLVLNARSRERERRV